MPALTPSQIRQYREDGYLILPEVLAPETLRPLVRELEAVIDAKAREQHAAGLLPRLHADAPFEDRLARLHADSREPEALWRAVQGKHLKTAGLFAVFTAPPLLDIVESLIGPEILAHPQFNTRAKLPGHDPTVVPWHQDLGYLDPEADGTFMVNFWIPLVDAPMETGALQVIPGSHTWGLVPHERVGIYLGIPEEKLPPHRVADCPVPCGGVLMLQHKSVHRSIPNTSGRVRWSLDLRYCDPALPSGRAGVPGFLARSRAHSERVARGPEDWWKLMDAAAAPAGKAR